MPLTGSQALAVAARGDVIVVAGAGTGKTHTLVERCLELIREGASVDRLLMVTFTEAAAAEMKHRLRLALQRVEECPGDPLEGARRSEQLALVETARISTLHSFCFRLVQEHFHELGLNPGLNVLDEPFCRLLREETLDGLMRDCYDGRLGISGAVRLLIEAYAPDRDSVVRQLVHKLHDYSQSLPDAAAWVERQRACWDASPSGRWEMWLLRAFEDWRVEWLSVIEPLTGVSNIDDCLNAMREGGGKLTRATVETVGRAVAAAGAADWPRGTAGTVRNPLKRFFEEAEFLASVAAPAGLEGDWQAVRVHMGALLALTQEFTARFARAKRDLGGVDFADLEQGALELLLDPLGRPTEIARHWQDRLDFVFVDECQDINSAQDAILTAVSRRGSGANRFLVGDVKQSIYQFRLANPQIFRCYEKAWGGIEHGEAGSRTVDPPRGGEVPGSGLPASVVADSQAVVGPRRRVVLSENFRSRPGILTFVNALFSALMRESFGGVEYEHLTACPGRIMQVDGQAPCVDLHFIRKPTASDEEGGDDEGVTESSAVELEARLVADRLKDLKDSGFEVWDTSGARMRPVEWQDMAVLMRSPGPRAEAYAKVFHETGIPLSVERAGFLEALEVSDLVSLLKLLDNPLQDVPLLAVLRSPLVGLTLEELASVRTASALRPFWLALEKCVADLESPEDGANRALTQEGGLPEGRSRAPGTGATCRGGAMPGPSTLARLSAFRRQYMRWRILVRQTGPSLCLEQVLSDTGYDVLLGADPRGQAKLTNVRRLLELARQFDPHGRQGLYRFLRFLKALEEAGQSLEPGPVSTRHAVRLMSIHRSKGLEFPVVALAGLGTTFNLSELNGLVLLDPEFGLAPKAMTAAPASRYPTLPHWLTAKRQRSQRLGEELRLLYVGATRARDRLVCFGTCSRKDQGTWSGEAATRIETRDLLGARSPLDWLFRWLPTVTNRTQWADAARGASPMMTWRLWDPTEFDFEKGGDLRSTSATGDWAAIDPVRLSALAGRLTWKYPWLAATQEPAKSSVTRLRRRAAELRDDDAVARFDHRILASRPGASQGRGAARRGTLHHLFLQHLVIDRAETVAELGEQVRELVRQGLIQEQEIAELDLDAIARFWRSELGRDLSRHAASVRRELPFTARFDCADLLSRLGQSPGEGLENEFVVVQGVIDLAVVMPREIWLLDFKTDRVLGETLQARARDYGSQLRLYAASIEQVLQKPVTRLWLHFLASGATLSIEPQV